MDKLLLVAFVAAVLWMIHSYFYPWKPCWKCRGNPKNTHRGYFNISCIICKGVGRRMRWGARLLGRGFGHL